MSKIRLYLLCLVLAVSWNGCPGGVDFSMLGSHQAATRLEIGTVIHHSPNLKEWDTKTYAKTNGEKTSPMKEGWSIITTDLPEVERALGTKLMETIMTLRKRYPNKELVIIDWGCGMGQAINTLADQARRAEVKNVKFVGYSNMYFPQWSVTRNVEFIFDEMDNLPKYLDNNSVALIFSHFGLYHVQGLKFLEHLRNLSTKMVTGGMIVTNTCQVNGHFILEASPYYLPEQYYTNYDKVYRLTRNSVGCGILTSSIPVR